VASKSCGEPPYLAPISRIPEEKEADDRHILPLGYVTHLLRYGRLATPNISVHPEDVRFIGVQDITPRPGGDFLDNLDPRSLCIGRVRRRSFLISSMGRILYELEELMQACIAISPNYGESRVEILTLIRSAELARVKMQHSFNMVCVQMLDMCIL
jgi:hypothetical protein